MPDLKGTTSEKLQQAMDAALKEKPNVADWTNSDVVEWFDLNGMDAETQAAIVQLLKSVADSMPASFADSIRNSGLSNATRDAAQNEIGAAFKDDESLLTNTFPIPIPKGEYHVLRSLTYGKVGDILAKTQNIGSPGSGEHDHKTFVLNSVHGPVKGTIGTPASGQPDPPDPPQSSAGGGGPEGAHQHHVLVPEKMRSLKPGDRVLVAGVQNEAVVIDIVVSS